MVDRFGNDDLTAVFPAGGATAAENRLSIKHNTRRLPNAIVGSCS
jgi:hypothetical protein